jgi:hypothetical protein
VGSEKLLLLHLRRKKQEDRREIFFLLNLYCGNLLTPGIILRNYLIKLFNM